MADPIVQRYTALAEQFGARVEAAPEDAWDAPSPCEGWTARDVLAHVVGGQRNVARAITGEEPSGDLQADPKGAWRSSFEAIKAADEQEQFLDFLGRTTRP